jgi:excisionase family DNA binding protein
MGNDADGNLETRGAGKMERMIGPEELSEALGVSRVSIYRWIRLKQIPFYHVERCVRFSPSEVRAWLEERRNRPLRMPRRLNRERPLDSVAGDEKQPVDINGEKEP